MSDVRVFFGKARVEDSNMGRGCVIVIEDRRLGDYPLASVNIPFKDQSVNRQVADFIVAKWNEAS